MRSAMFDSLKLGIKLPEAWLMEPYQQLELEWAKFNDLDPQGMVACSSGTAALHLALEAMQLPPGSEVLVPDFTMIACPRAVTLAGLTPVFVDCDERLLMDYSLAWNGYLAEDEPAQRVKAVMAVHVYGRNTGLEQLRAYLDGCDVCSRIKVVEDLAEAHGVRPHEKTDAACWSFYKNKIVAGEEGGAVWFRDPEHAALARSLRSLGFTDAHDFWHVPRGHNYRMSNLHAEAILGWNYQVSIPTYLNNNSLSSFKANIERRREIEGWYDKHCPDEWRMPRRDAVWVHDLRISQWNYVRLVDDGKKRGLDEVVAALRTEGIEARHGFKPCHSQREYNTCRFVTASVHVARSERVSDEVLYLPVLPGRTTEEDCRRAFDVIRKVVTS